MFSWLTPWWNKSSTDSATEKVIDLRQLSQSMGTQGDGTKDVTSGQQQLLESTVKQGDDTHVASQQQPSETTARRDDDSESIASDDDGPFLDTEEYLDGMSKEEYFILQKEAKEKFGKCIKNGTIDEVSIGKYNNGNLHVTIKLQDNKDNNTSVEISEIVNSTLRKNEKITGLSILDRDGNKIVSCDVEKVGEKEVRRYNLGATGTHGMQFKWPVDGRECSIILTANSDGSIKIVGDKPTDKDLEENAEVRINVKGCYVTLADAVREALKGQEQHSETVEGKPQPKASEEQEQHSEIVEGQPQPKASARKVHGEFTRGVVEESTKPKEGRGISQNKA